MGIRQELQMWYRDGCGFKPGDFLVPKVEGKQYEYGLEIPVYVISQNSMEPWSYYVGGKIDERFRFGGSNFKERYIDGFEWRKEDE